MPSRYRSWAGCKAPGFQERSSEKGIMSTAKRRRRNRGRSAAYNSKRLHCATCGRELSFRLLQVRDESFCSGILAREFFWDLDEPSVKLEPGNILIGGTNGYFHIDTGNVDSKEKKEELEDV